MSEISEYFSKIGTKGGKSRMAKLSEKKLSELGRKAAQARWKKHKKKV